jgi:hypothetical protein
MNAEEFNKSDVSIVSACDVNPTLLIDFYKQVFSERNDFFQTNWKWLNRTSFYNNTTPLVLIFKNQVIAHAGMIPVSMVIADKIFTASWFIDFAVLPEFQRFGLGSMLTKRWMQFSDIQITFCNEKSIGVFKKLGWAESFNTYMHINIVSPFNHPRLAKILPSFFRKIFNRIVYPFVYLFYKKDAYTNIDSRLHKMSESSINNFLNLYSVREKSGNSAFPIRDLDFLKWRVLNSPNKNNYYTFNDVNFSAIISVQNKDGGYIDVLCVSDVAKKTEIRNMINTLAIWALKKKLSRIRFYSSDKNLSDYLKKTTGAFVKHPRFAFFTENKSLFEKLKSIDWQLELIDSDFEHIY